MRAGGCTVQQALTVDAAAVVKQAVTLARRRGHAQVTPLHVANTMLSSATGLLRTACLQSQSNSHPLQCKALELCFNVALNRLPASTSSPMLGHHSQQYPSISNALVAAFKRAQAHQRRGSIENQQQPLLAVKIELEQLIISILDDPSVSRVMREAGFSSTQVKSNVEQAVSLEICSQNTSSAPPVSNSSKSKENNNNNNSNVLALSHIAQVGAKTSCRSPPRPPLTASIASTNNLDPIKNEDVMSVIDNLMSRRKGSVVIVGECLGSVERVVRGVMEKVFKGEVPDVLKEVKFVPFPISSLGHLSSRVEVDQKLEDLKVLVRSYLSKGVVLNLGDLKWVIEHRGNNNSNLSPMEHVIMEIGKLVSGICEANGKFWLMGIATFKTYMKCKSSGNPSLETIWGLHALTIPAGSLRLSLITDSGVQSQCTSNQKGSESWIIIESEVDSKQLTCCVDCASKFENEARSLQSSTCNSDSTTTSTLPAWLQQYKNDQNKGLGNSNDQDCVSIKDLCKKWNSICTSIHQQPNSSEKTITFSSVSPSSSNSGFSCDLQYPNMQQNIHHRHQDWPIVEAKRHSWRDHHFWVGSESTNKMISSCTSTEPSLRMYIPEHNRDQYHKPSVPFSSIPNSTPNSTSSSDVMEMDPYLHKFKELNAENLKILCNALEEKVPWQRDIIPDIASTILQCRSGMVRRKGNSMKNMTDHQAKEETWLVFQGVDMEAKEKVAKELAKLIFGSQHNFLSIALSSFSSTRADSTEDCRNKRSRDEQSCSYIERFAEAVSSNPHRVFFVEDVEQADYCSQIGFKRAIERGKIANSSGEEVGLHDAIIILSCESFSSRSRACSPPIKQKTEGNIINNNCHQDREEEKGNGGGSMDETSPCVSLDLNISIDDDSAEDDQSIDDIGLLESVDRRIVFKFQEL